MISVATGSSRTMEPNFKRKKQDNVEQHKPGEKGAMMKQTPDKPKDQNCKTDSKINVNKMMLKRNIEKPRKSST